MRDTSKWFFRFFYDFLTVLQATVLRTTVSRIIFSARSRVRSPDQCAAIGGWRRRVDRGGRATFVPDFAALHPGYGVNENGAAVRSVRQFDVGGALEDDFAGLGGHGDLYPNHRAAEGRPVDFLDHFAVDVGDVALERGTAELGFGVPDKAVVTGPIGDVVDVPGVHGCTVAVHATHADVSGILEVDVVAVRTLAATNSMLRVCHS